MLRTLNCVMLPIIIALTSTATMAINYDKSFKEYAKPEKYYGNFNSCYRHYKEGLKTTVRSKHRATAMDLGVAGIALKSPVYVAQFFTQLYKETPMPVKLLWVLPGLFLPL